jgi:4-hydroxy-3-polyprenylbenzoate decarboxylase
MAAEHPATGAKAGEMSNMKAGPRDLRDWLSLIEAEGDLHRITAPVDADEELSAITYMATRDEAAPALLFENIRGNESGIPVLINFLGARARRFALALGMDPDLGLGDMIGAMRARAARRIPPVEVAPDAAPVNATILTGEDIDLTRLPAPRFWPGDGGRYIGTGDITLTRDPDSGRINVGCYRQMLHGPRRVGLYCSPGKNALRDREAWWRRGEPCEVVVAYGVDPASFMVAAQAYPTEVSELEVIGGITGVPVELTSGVATDLPIPARAEIVIEGVLHADDLADEGPLGEFTGYYGRPRGPQPVIEVKALHMRENPILTAALMADFPSCESGPYYAIMRSAAIWDDLERFGIPGIRGVYCHPAAASGWGMIALSVEQKYPGHVAQALGAAAQCPAGAYFTKWIIAVDEDVDPTDMNQVLWAQSTRCNPVDDIDIQRNTWSTGLDPSQYPPEARPYASKALIDACKPHRYIDQFPRRTMVRRSVYQRLTERWDEFGLPQAAPTLRALEDD